MRRGSGWLGCGLVIACAGLLLTPAAAGGALDGVCPANVPEAQPTRLIYLGATDGAYGDPLELIALLSGTSGLPLPGRQVAFMLGAQGAAAVTDANGVATVIITPLGLPGPTALTATFAGDAEAVQRQKDERLTPQQFT